MKWFRGKTPVTKVGSHSEKSFESKIMGAIIPYRE